ncbi:protein NirF [Persephonella hydrogeniphila]|uniref:Protein NirF n=1 Tax=Persephonella hydrogeniphila TaxID=198703 RepID=A0A285NLG7_9AQUI|nr:cytochrome D1 domain-containing protein [Persephonella hydrogeniphila]SNZ10350.1 protein NirF [Persephonella hydrogeniphila]
MLYLILPVLIFFQIVFAEKLYVVERERGSLAVIEDDKFVGEINDLGNLNHAIVKTDGDFSYCISRNGYFSKIDNRNDRLIKKIKPGNSGIGFTFIKNYIAIAHYDPKKVTILTKDLEIKKVIDTGSRNVGIKPYKNLLTFSLMDRDEIWVLDANKDFKIVHKVKNAGKMPFDALIDKNRYIVGFFKEKGVGILDLDSFVYKKAIFHTKNKEEIVFKIPHFGMWGVINDTALIPAIGEKRSYVVDIKNMKVIKHIDLPGLPVFISVSPLKNIAVVNFSGDKDHLLAVIDIKNLKVIKTFTAGKRVMHMRFSKDGEKLYVSSYFDNSLKIFDTNSWKLLKEITVPTPSGVFIVR